MWRTRAGALAYILVAAASVTACSGSSGALVAGPAGAITSGGPAAGAPCTGTSARATGSGALPDLTLQCLGSGPAVDVSGLAGPAVVNLWASWCYPCRTEMPLLEKASSAAGNGVRIVGVNTNDRAASAVNFVTNTVHATYEELSDPTGKLAVDLHAPGLPYTVAIDRSGVIVWRKAGELTGADLASAVKAAQVAG